MGKVLLMVVRIRWEKAWIVNPAKQIQTARGTASSFRFEKFALIAAALLTPSALVAFTLAFWSVASDLHWAGDFFLSHGLFSHWQVWICAAAVLLFLARLLDRFASTVEHYPVSDE